MTNTRFLVSMLHDILGAQSRVEQVISADVLQSWQSHHEDILSALAARNLDRAIASLKEDIVKCR